MVRRDQRWLYLALAITIGVHIAVVTPLSKWFDRVLLPLLTDENIIIELSEILPVEKTKELLKPDPQPVKVVPPPKPQPLKDEPPPPEPEKPPEKVAEPLPPPDIAPKPPPPAPREKIALSEDLEDDIILTPSIRQAEPKISKPEPEPIKPKQELSKPKPEPILPKQELPPPEPPAVPEKAVPKQTANQEVSIVRSPLRMPESNSAEKPEETPSPIAKIPEQVKETFRGGEPEHTISDQLQYSLNTYKWTFKRFIDNWAVDIQRWWRAPMDYAMGDVPEGGDLWVEVRLSPSGILLGYKVYKSKVTAEMELRVVQALIGSMQRPALPESFKDTELIVNWRFIYPPIRPPIKLRR